MGTRITGELQEIAERVRHDHETLERILDRIRADSVRLRLGMIPKHCLEDEIYRLWSKLEEHTVTEERLLTALLPRLASDEAARIQLMLLEHDLQRRLLLSLLDLTEPGVLARGDLIRASTRLVRTLRADIALEEEMLADLGSGSQTRTSAR
jgi:hypothetical protein